MCLGIPGRITEVWDEDGAPMANVDFAGQVRRISLAYLPGLTAGEYVITHTGYALTRLTEQDAAATLAMMRSAGVLDAPGQPAPADAGPPATGPPTTGPARA
jgi:hydrogenase expression/formation protein HypC